MRSEARERVSREHTNLAERRSRACNNLKNHPQPVFITEVPARVSGLMQYGLETFCTLTLFLART